MTLTNHAVTKSIRLAPEESRFLQKVCQVEHLSEATFMRKLVLEGLAERRLQQACQAYARKELNLSAAAQYAQVSVYQMMTELERRNIPVNASMDKFLDGLEHFANAFGGSPAMRQVIAEARQP